MSKQFTTSEITEGLDLLGDFLDAKGYTEEAGLCTRAMDEINALREECSNLKNELAKWVNYWRDKDVKALQADNSLLRQAMHDIYEVYAGSEGFIPETCAEAYLQDRVKEMAYIAGKHKRGGESDE